MHPQPHSAILFSTFPPIYKKARRRETAGASLTIIQIRIKRGISLDLEAV